jgi:recombination protein RecT
MTETLTGALEVAKQTPKQRQALDLLARSKPEVAKLLPPGVTIDRFERTVRTCLRTTPLLAECSAESFLGAVMHTAQLGLEPGPLGLVYLIPYKREVVCIVGYRGYVELAYRAGQVKDVQAELVYEGDVFEVHRGTSPKILHMQHEAPGEREIVAAYAVAHLKTGGTVSRVVYEAEWEKARAASQLGRKNEGPWADHRPAMIRKTALRRLEPWLPKTPAFGLAFTVDEQPAERLDDMIAGEPLALTEGSADAAD